MITGTNKTPGPPGWRVLARATAPVRPA
jgi:hypothetical protein